MMYFFYSNASFLKGNSGDFDNMNMLRWRKQFGRSVLKPRLVGVQMTQVTKAQPRSKSVKSYSIPNLNTMSIPSCLWN